MSQTIGTGNYQIRPVRNPRYYEGSKNAKSGKDAPFLREGELIDQVSKGVKTRTKPAGDGIVPKVFNITGVPVGKPCVFPMVI